MGTYNNGDIRWRHHCQRQGSGNFVKHQLSENQPNNIRAVQFVGGRCATQHLPRRRRLDLQIQHQERITHIPRPDRSKRLGAEHDHRQVWQPVVHHARPTRALFRQGKTIRDILHNRRTAEQRILLQFHIPKLIRNHLPRHQQRNGGF